jgi:2'-5' RNA ligase
MGLNGGGLVANLVIVAIPADGDSVWQVSSEKKPHLTILFLGDAMTNPNVTKIAEKVGEMSKHVDPFSLLVDHRGTLGSDEADVLFFTQDIPWKLFDFRSMCLGNQEISMAYNAIPQHQTWKPHLTLGYPETPAHSDDWDPMVPQYVTFDKIGVWYGDSEGPEYVLTESDLSREEEAVAWAEGAVNTLTHHGVKGMRWGVRRKNVGTTDEKVVSTDAKKAAGARDKAKKHGKQALSNEEMQALVTRMNLERQLTQLTPPSRAQKGAKFVGKMLVNTGNAQVQRVVNDQATKAVKKAIGV